MARKQDCSGSGKSLIITLMCTVLIPVLFTRNAWAADTNTEWSLIGGNALEQHYSPLKQVNVSNVGRLKLEWYIDMPTEDGLTGIPIIVDSMVYQSGALGKVWAHDVKTGEQIWSYDADIGFPLGVVPSWGARLSRGLAVWEDTVLKATGDCRLIALDRMTGTKRWQATTCDTSEYKTITGAPRVGDGKVFIGNANADTGVGRGYVDAYNIETGKHLWRFYTIPGNPEDGFENAAMSMAAKTWGEEYWLKSGGGSAWEGITYDPRTDLVYIGTDGPSPFSPVLRGSGAGDELFTNALVAVKADTGEYVWHYSTTPGDGWNYAATFPVILADLELGGAEREVIFLSPKNGFFYVLDASTGDLLNQPKNIIPVNWASHIDMKTGRPVYLSEARYWEKGAEGAIVSPSPMGARNWMPMSYNPESGLVYIPATDYPAKIVSDPKVAIGSVDVDFYYSKDNNEERYKGILIAWDPIEQEARWRRDIGRPYQGGTLTTAGNLVFQGTSEGGFYAYHAETGERLWEYALDSAILGAASTVMVGENQLVLVAAGSGTTSSVGFAAEFSGGADGPARLLAFSLDGDKSLPTSNSTIKPDFPKPGAPEPADNLVKAGKAVWDANGCEICHGYRVVGGPGSVPDLRRRPLHTPEVFSAIVRGGLFKSSGMPVFEDTISEEDLPALQAYILKQSWRAYRGDNQ